MLAFPFTGHTSPDEQVERGIIAAVERLIDSRDGPEQQRNAFEVEKATNEYRQRLQIARFVFEPLGVGLVVPHVPRDTAFVPALRLLYKDLLQKPPFLICGPIQRLKQRRVHAIRDRGDVFLVDRKACDRPLTNVRADSGKVVRYVDCVGEDATPNVIQLIWTAKLLTQLVTQLVETLQHLDLRPMQLRQLGH